MFIVPVSRDTRSLSRWFDSSLDRVFAGETAAPRAPALDVAESDTAYTVQLEVPGVSKEDLKVSVEGRRVTVQAQTERSDEKKETDRIVYRERSAASYARSFVLPQEVENAESQAKLENGVLTLSLPKRSARAAAQLTVN